MESLLSSIALQSGEIGVVLYALWRSVKSMREEVEQIKSRVDKRLNNGIKDELSKLAQSVAHIQGQIEGMPRRSTDKVES